MSLLKRLKPSRNGKKFSRPFFYLAVFLLLTLLPLPSVHPQTPPKAPPAKAEDFYPLRAGNFWSYQVEIEEQEDTEIKPNPLLFWKEPERKTRIFRYQSSYVLSVVSVENKVTHKEVKLKKEWVGEKRPIGERNEEFIYKVAGPDIVQVSERQSEVRYRFPLYIGARWGDPKQIDRIDLSYFYSLEKQENAETPAGKFPESYWIIYRTRPDHTIEWFYPGVGVVKREYHHHGTVLNMTENLVQYKVK